MEFSKNSSKDIGSRLEKAVSEFLGWKIVSGSGARDFHPGDLISDDWMGECKTHVHRKDSITFYKSHWEKISEEAYSHFKYPVLFCDDGSQSADNTWCICRRISVNANSVLDLPFKFRKNLTFNLGSCDKSVVYRFMFGEDLCVLCHLSKFAEIANSVECTV